MPGNGKGKGNGMGKKQNGKANGNGKKQPRRGKGNGSNQVTRDKAENVFAPNVGYTPVKAFGDTGSRGLDMRCWDAKMPQHLALPRAVGPYTTIRTTRRFSNNAAVNIFGTCQNLDSDTGSWLWSSNFAMRPINAAADISAANNTAFTTMDLTSIGLGSTGGGFPILSGGGATIVPSALTVQVMNPNSLTDTEGMIYAGVSNTQLGIQTDVGGVGRTWDQFADQFIQYQNPRLLAAAKLALKGIQIDSYPLNMQKCSEFTKANLETDTPGGTWSPNLTTPMGWAPIVVLNNAATGTRPTLEFLVTIEWRCRFDISSVAAASHTYHPLTTDMHWAAMMRRASARGNGVRDICETPGSVV